MPVRPDPKLPLQGLHVLVTRPEQQAQGQVRLLESGGAQVTHLPMLKIEPCHANQPGYEQLKNQIIHLDRYAIIICISANAARLGLDWMDRYWPQWPVGIDWYAIGQKTAQVLAVAGITAQTAVQGFDSEALLAEPGLVQVRTKNVLIMRGAGGRDTLAQILTERGAHVEYAELYQRRCPVYSTAEILHSLYQPSLTSILITSGEALANFVKVAGSQRQFSLDSRLGLTLIVPSKRIADQARKIGFRHIIVAQGADDAAMVAALDPANDWETAHEKNR